MKQWKDYLDEKGMIRHLPGPEPLGDGTPNGGGDAINRHGHVDFCYQLVNQLSLLSYNQMLDIFPSSPIDLHEVIWLCMDKKAGCFARYWQAPYNNALDQKFGTGRDQFEPPMIAGLLKRDITCFQILKMTEMREGAMPNLNIAEGDLNGDALFPDNWAALYRAKATNGDEIRIFLGDLYLIFQVIIRCILSHKDHDDVGDSLNITMRTILGAHVRPTWASRLACWLFGKFIYGGVQYQLDVYFKPNHAPPINECYRPIVSKVFPKPFFIDSV